jgi:uncharacterized protein (TIGR03086 family)
MSSTPATVGGLARGLAAVEEIVAAIGEHQWSSPTPCPTWSVRKLLNHLVGGNRGFAAVLTDQVSPDWRADHLAADPLGAHRQAAAELQAAFARPGALEKVVTVPFGTVPGAVALHLRITEILVHGWDLAYATGQAPTGLPADLAEQELEFSRSTLDAIPAGQHPFAPPQPVHDHAPAIDRLAALLGRSVTSTSTEFLP